MGLTKDLEKAFLKSLDNPKQSGNVPQLAVDVAKAIFDFLISLCIFSNSEALLIGNFIQEGSLKFFSNLI